ncbi:cytolethal distending toxin, subunit CdtA [Campylobacter vicugnae]|uniref:Cytolethal distending toxin, subunit CdtA n=1 Tax=Campylobacter vicugnae TaxID=1660076 RepID=A0A1X9T3K4_9BACT|nr:hypothetical protein [Campylobacter sp. RM8964]ARR03023.1 cytolethal distending toxin, subunit CdtA [Campylobacter sp. RM8964]
MRVDNNNNIKQYIYSNNNNNIKRVLKHISNFLLLPLSILISISILSGCSSKNIDSINNSNLVTTSFANGNGMFLKLDDSKGFAGDSIKAPDELKAPDRNPNISSENIKPILKASMLSDEFTPPLSLRSLDTGLPLIVNLNKPDETFNWNLREVKAFNPSIISSIKSIDNFRNLKFEYIQFVSTNNIDMCLAIDESGLFTLKSCSDDLNNKKFETVYQLIPMNTDAVQIRSLVLNGKECISTFENPNLEPWQRVGINRCTLDETFIADIKRLWAIMPELRAAMVLLPIE